jgi:amino acid transporter
MNRYEFTMNCSASTAANCDGACAARTSESSASFALIAGIALAVSALFVFAMLGLRLTLNLHVMGLIAIIAIIMNVIVLILVVRTFPEHRKR